MAAESARRVVVGVTPRQPDAVVIAAADFAEQFDAELICAHVDRGRYTVDEAPDGSVTSVPVDPDLADLREQEFDPELHARLASILDRRRIPWSTRALAGDPAHSLGRLAETVQASMIVIGTRNASFRGTLQELFNGSVAVHLAHRQHRPVVVIPLSPVPFGKKLTWDPE